MGGGGDGWRGDGWWLEGLIGWCHVGWMGT